MNVKRTAKNSRFIREELWIRDWDDMGSLLNEDAVKKLEQAGWMVFWAKLSDHGKTAPMFEGDNGPNGWREFNIKLIVDIYPIAADIKRSLAARRLCELVHATYIHSVNTQKGVWRSYAGGYVAIFLPRHSYPPNATDKIMKRTDNCLAYVMPLREAQEQIRELI